jgi:lysozyme family protein
MLIGRMNASRAARYRALRTFDVFGAGWMRRLSEVTARALAEAAPHAPEEGTVA